MQCVSTKGILLQEADLLLGDVGITFERKKAAEFSFFTLVDSGAFVTHSPRKLSEAFALIRPFRKEVWPFLILTVVISGPAFYYIVALPYWWQDSTFTIRNCFNLCNDKSTRMKKSKKTSGTTLRKNIFFSEVYLKEMSYGIRTVRLIGKQKIVDEKKIPKHLFRKCIWFSITLFLKQSNYDKNGRNDWPYILSIMLILQVVMSSPFVEYVQNVFHLCCG